jgi:prevent-host-death family protein
MKQQIGAAEFKARCLSILDHVGVDGIVITKRGRPVAELVPIRPEPANLIGALKGKLEIKGSILSTGVKWVAES